MTFSVSVNGASNNLEVAMYRTHTGNESDYNNIALHDRVCDKLEPVIYEAFRKLVREHEIQATIKWDGNTIKVK